MGMKKSNPHKRKHLITMLPDDLWEKLRLYAQTEFNGRQGSLSIIVEKSLREYLESHKHK